MAVGFSHHLNYLEGCEFCKQTIWLIEWKLRYKNGPYFLPCCLLNQFQHQITEYQELLEACITLSPESVQGSFDALWDAFHELKFTLLYENENNREFFGPKIKSLLQTSQDTWSFGKLWRVQNIVNEVITGSSILDFIMCPTLPNGNTFQFSPYVFTLCVFSKYNEADIKKFIDIIYRQHNHSNGWVIPIICDDSDETNDEDTINSIKQIPILLNDSEIDLSAFCIFIAKPYLRIGIVVLSIINFHYQSYYRLWSSLLNNLKLIKRDIIVTNFEYLTNRIVYLIWEDCKLSFSCLITHRKYGCTDIMEQSAFQDAIIPIGMMYLSSEIMRKVFSQYILLICVPRTNLVYIINVCKKVYALYVNLLSIYWNGGYNFTYVNKLDRILIDILEDIYWRDIIALFFIKIGERYDSIENTNDDPTLKFMESLPGFNNMLDKLREITNGLANFSTEITTETDGRIAFRPMFSNADKLDYTEFFYNCGSWQLIDLKTIKYILNTTQQDPLDDINMEEAVRHLHIQLRIENKTRIFKASTSQEVNISEVCFVY